MENFRVHHSHSVKHCGYASWSDVVVAAVKAANASAPASFCKAPRLFLVHAIVLVGQFWQDFAKRIIPYHHDCSKHNDSATISNGITNIVMVVFGLYPSCCLLNGRWWLLFGRILIPRRSTILLVVIVVLLQSSPLFVVSLSFKKDSKTRFLYKPIQCTRLSRTEDLLQHFF